MTGVQTCALPISQKARAPTALTRRNEVKKRHEGDLRRREAKAVKPFVFQTDVRASIHEEELRSRIEKEREEEGKRRQFVAKPAPCLRTVTLAQTEVKGQESTMKRTKPLARIDNVVLASDERAKKRQEFDRVLAEKHAAEELARQQAEEESAERERAEIRELRKVLIHHPQPILPDSLIEIRKSEKPLTVPQSPNFITKQRAMQKARESLMEPSPARLGRLV